MVRILRFALPIFMLLAMYTPKILAQQRGFRPVNVKVDGQPTALYSGSHALVIGISNYTNGWPQLPGVKNDLAKVKAALEKQDFNVITLSDPDKAGIDKAITNFIGKYGQDQNNRLLFYFAGHGHTIRTSYGEELGYFVPSDAPNPNRNQAEFQEKSIEMAQIDIYARRINAKHALFLFDACFSGSLFALSRAIPASITYSTSKPVRQFITSGSADQTVPDKSIFCEQFVAGLSGEADMDKDGYITGAELGYFLNTQVVNYSRNSQNPQYGKIRNPNLDKGDFVFIAGATASPAVRITEEKNVHFGKVSLASEIAGNLYLDGNFLRTVTPLTQLTLNEVPSGNHELKIVGEETWIEAITVSDSAIVTARAISPRLLDEKAWSDACKINTKEAYVQYTTTFPSGQNRLIAKDNIAWLNAAAQHTSKAYNDYVSAFPNGKFALQAYEEMTYLTAKASGKTEDYEKYNRTYPTGKYRAEVLTYLENVYFSTAENYYYQKNFESARQWYNKYLTGFPSGQNATSARNQLKQTEQAIQLQAIKIKQDTIAHLFEQANLIRKEATKKYWLGTAQLAFSLVLAGGGGLLAYDGISNMDDGTGIANLVLGALGVSVGISGFVTTGKTFKYANEKKRESRRYRDRAQSINISWAPIIRPKQQVYGIGLTVCFR